jgi:hypothetical protein
MTEQLKAELRTSLRPRIEAETRSVLKAEISQDCFVMNKLREEAKNELKRVFQLDKRLRDEVKDEIKREIRREWQISGRERELVLEAMQDI